MANGSGQSSPHVTMNCVELKKREHWATNPLMKNQQEPQEQSEGNSSAPDEGSPSAAQKPIRNGWLARIGRSFSIASKLGKNEAKSKAEVVSKGAVVHKIEQFVKGK